MTAIGIVLWIALGFSVLSFAAALVDVPHRVASGTRPIRATVAAVMVVLCVNALSQWWGTGA